MQSRKQKKILIIIAFIFISGIIIFSFRHQIKRLYGQYFGGSRKGSNIAAECEVCSGLFTDGIAQHEKAYNSEGINSQPNDEALLNLERNGVLSHIQTNDNYIVRDIDYGKPLLLPKAIRFLDKLSELYSRKCSDYKLEYVPFEITNATRSMESVDEIRKVNPNAIENSPHLHGKTFDMSYRAFGSNKKQLKQYVAALSELRKQRECFVKFESNGCLHITVN
ncbi:MAG: hypothetical protein FGM46_06880 [Ferruginibacter sp.]|nr:hypothetical protein [Ferruginibacter sp.]